jgi:hypothetical protein
MMRADNREGQKGQQESFPAKTFYDVGREFFGLNQENINIFMQQNGLAEHMSINKGKQVLV